MRAMWRILAMGASLSSLLLVGILATQYNLLQEVDTSAYSAGEASSLAEDSSLIDRAVIVTGGSRGLGREMALTLVKAGARVAVVGLTDSAHLAKTVQDADAAAGAGRLIPIVADVRRDADCQRVVAQTVEAFGAIHALFNNAGLGIQVVENYSEKPRTMFWET